MGTGKEQKIRITASSGLSKDEVDRMVGEAEEHAAEDRKQRELIDIRNQADSVIYSVEKTLRDYGEKISFEDRSNISKHLDDLKSKKEGNDINAIKQAMDTVQQAVYKISETIYREAGEKAQAEAKTEGPQAEQPKPEEPEQAEGGADYRVVDEDTDKGQEQ
jgi:molecular chaperone DnaK